MDKNKIVLELLKREPHAVISTVNIYRPYRERRTNLRVNFLRSVSVAFLQEGVL